MQQHLSTLDALKAVAAGQKIPRSKYVALQRASYVKVVGQRKLRHPIPTDAGQQALQRGKVGR